MIMEKKDCTHKLLCRHAVGSNGKFYYMDCIPIKEMNDGRIKILVFGDRFWKGNDKKKNIRYVDSNRVTEK